MLPVKYSRSTSAGGGYAALKAEYANLRWVTSLLFIAAMAIPCTFFFHSATPRVSFLLSIQGEPRPRDHLADIPIKATWGGAAAASTGNSRRSTESDESAASSFRPKTEITNNLLKMKSSNSSSITPAQTVVETSKKTKDNPAKTKSPAPEKTKPEKSNVVPAKTKPEKAKAKAKDVPAKKKPEKAKDVSAKTKPEISMKSEKSSGAMAKPATSNTNFGELESEDLRLEKVLKAAAMKDKTVIITTSNAAWATPGSVMDLFLESFHNGNGTEGLLKHVLIVALDPQAYDRCKALHPHCFALTTEGVDFSAEKSFMSDGYLQLVWRKLDILRTVLRKGYHFIFTDADVMWFRNPIPEFLPDVDFQSSCDKYVGDSSDLMNEPNTGFKYVKANERTIAFYDFWYDSRLKYPGFGQQGVFNEIKLDPYIKKIGVSLRFLTDQVFGGLCDPPKQVSGVCTMHTTCCVGLHSKVHDLEVLRADWRMYTSLPEILRQERHYMWSELQLICRYLE